MYKIRTLSNYLENVDANFKAVLVTGMRQVGKTTFLRNAASKERRYVSLDNPKDLLLAKNDAALFLQTYQMPLFIDEVQYAPELFPYLKMALDKNEETGKLWMSGSQQFLMMKNVSESLAGRIIIMKLLGFSIYERMNRGGEQKPFLPTRDHQGVLENLGVNETYKIIWQGSYPGIVDKDPMFWEGFYDSYLQTYLERDVRSLVNISDSVQFLTFLKVVAARTGQELDIADIARNVDIAPNTAKKWLSILEASGVIYLLQPFYMNLTKRFIKKPKIYFLDTGLCAYLTDWKTPETLQSGAMSGAIFETFVISEIIKSYWHCGLNPSFYFYRDNSKVEIDLLISQNNTLYPIEIKKTANPTPEHVANFKKLKIPNVETGFGSLICLTEEIRLLTDYANSISIWDI